MGASATKQDAPPVTRPSPCTRAVGPRCRLPPKKAHSSGGLSRAHGQGSHPPTGHLPRAPPFLQASSREVDDRSEPKTDNGCACMHKTHTNHNTPCVLRPDHQDHTASSPLAAPPNMYANVGKRGRRSGRAVQFKRARHRSEDLAVRARAAHCPQFAQPFPEPHPRAQVTKNINALQPVPEPHPRAQVTKNINALQRARNWKRHRARHRAQNVPFVSNPFNMPDLFSEFRAALSGAATASWDRLLFDPPRVDLRGGVSQPSACGPGGVGNEWSTYPYTARVVERAPGRRAWSGPALRDPPSLREGHPTSILGDAAAMMACLTAPCVVWTHAKQPWKA